MGCGLLVAFTTEMHRHVSPSGQIQQAQHVSCAGLLMGQPVRDRDRFNAHVRSPEQVRNRHQIVVTGVSINDHHAWRRRLRCDDPHPA